MQLKVFYHKPIKSRGMSKTIQKQHTWIQLNVIVYIYNNIPLLAQLKSHSEQDTAV